jgi:hypothetical protein
MEDRGKLPRMPIHVEIDDALLAEAQRLGGHLTKKAAVTAALQEYIRHRKQASIVDLFGTITYDPAYDYKKQRVRSTRKKPRARPTR